VSFNELRGLYPGQTLQIVGKGPSLRYLAAADFSAGPVITLNESILVVQALGLDNPLYSMQKDGCGINEMRCTGECQMRPPMCYPRPEIPVILQWPDFSEHCLPKHARKIFVDPLADLGFQEASVMSSMMAVRIGRLMGCASFRFLCCDSLRGDYRTLNVRNGELSNRDQGHYQAVIPHLINEMKSFQYQVILPLEKA
jgi:hypothetical protein